MTAPELPGPVTPERVRAQFELSASNAPDELLTPVCDAVNEFLASIPPTTPARQQLGGVMLAGRLWRRRGSPGGIEQVTEVGPAYVARYDPDLARLLGLNQPAVG